jgi:hypothetical protein
MREEGKGKVTKYKSKPKNYELQSKFSPNILPIFALG